VTLPMPQPNGSRMISQSAGIACRCNTSSNQPSLTTASRWSCPSRWWTCFSRTAWRGWCLVCGWKKFTAVFRALPKALRKPLVPVPDHAREALPTSARTSRGRRGDSRTPGDEDGRLQSGLPGFYEWLAQWVTQRAGAPVTAADLAALVLPEHLRMNIRVVDAQDRVLAEGRDLVAIRKKLYGAAGSPALTDTGTSGRIGSGGRGPGGSSLGRIGAATAPARRATPSSAVGFWRPC